VRRGEDLSERVVRVVVLRRELHRVLAVGPRAVVVRPALAPQHLGEQDVGRDLVRVVEQQLLGGRDGLREPSGVVERVQPAGEVGARWETERGRPVEGRECVVVMADPLLEQGEHVEGGGVVRVLGEGAGDLGARPVVLPGVDEQARTAPGLSGAHSSLWRFMYVASSS
jgi:hypothetical protein